MNEDTKNIKINNLIGCARCGDNHTNLEFKKFSKEPIEDTDGTIWNYWALCPVTNEPILMKFIDNK